MCLKILLFLALALLLETTRGKDPDEDKAYEFGFTIEGQQHRHEKKDINGIIQGEFGFITADGIYHVTVYATDENGDFKILSMKNIRVSPPLDGSGTPAQSPRIPNFQNKTNPIVVQKRTDTTTRAPFTTQSTIKPACAGCGYITTPKPTPLGQKQNTGSIFGSVNQGKPTPSDIVQPPFTSNQISKTNQYNSKNTLQNKYSNAGNGYNNNNVPLQVDLPNNQIPLNQNIPLSLQNPTYNSPGSYKDSFSNPNTISDAPKHVADITLRNPQKTEVQVSKGVIKVNGNPDIPIVDKYPGMVDGLPPGIEEKDIKDILYRFNYTVGFHGHYETGYKNGAKIGGYFVNGRDGFSRVVTYVADEKGYRPKFKMIHLGLNSPDTPKEDTEKSFGLKNFEFVWYPIK